jgi:hypothetical protein
VRAPPEQIPAPAFPVGLPWVNVAPLRMDKQLHRPVLVEFWDFCRVNSLRTLPYVKAWHERYADDGLRVIGVHTPGFPCSAAEGTVRAACERLQVEHPVCIDAELEVWREYGNAGWPARYLFDGRSRLFDYHLGEGGYEETERAIQELLGVQRDFVAPVRPEDAPDAEVVVQSADQPGAYSGPYEAGGVWAVLEGSGSVAVNGTSVAVTRCDCYPLIEHARHTAGVLDLQVGEGVVCHATCFTPGAP